MKGRVRVRKLVDSQRLLKEITLVKIKRGMWQGIRE